MKAAKIVKTVRVGSLRIDVRRYADDRFGFDYQPGGLERKKVRLDDLDAAIARAKEVMGATQGGKIDLLAIDPAEFAEFLRWRATKAKTVKVPVLVEAFMKTKEEKGLSWSHLKGLRNTLNAFAEAFPGAINAIMREDITKWLDSRKCGPRRWNNLLTHVISLHKFARREGALTTTLSPAELIERKTVNYKVQTYTPDELEKLLGVVSPSWLPLIVLGAFAGLRPEEICPDTRSGKHGLTWQSFLWHRAKIDVPASLSKVRRRRFVPLCDAAMAYLAPYRESVGLVVPPMKVSNFIAKWTKASGVAWRTDGLRHSYASYRLALTQDIQALSLEMGNSPKMIHDHYLDLKHEDEARAWFALRPPDAMALHGTSR